MIRRIHVRLELKTDAANRETVERVHGFYADKCPLYRTIKGSIAITTDFKLV